ncbi:MAG TPA: hypothetical protein ENN54_03390 [Thermoplasmatales archaeon]|nr:hypothetical protein [Thermoplasmatales archaeon]
MPVVSGTSSAELKPPGGKLLRCTLTIKEGVIASIRFSGDFFLIPGEKMVALEDALTRMEVEKIERVIHSFFSTAHVDMLGVAPEHFVETAKMALAKLH